MRHQRRFVQLFCSQIRLGLCSGNAGWDPDNIGISARVPSHAPPMMCDMWKTC